MSDVVNRRTWWTAVVVAALVIGAAVTGTAAAQMVGGNLSGRILDDNGGALPGVTVTITNKNNGAQQTVVTSGEGSYRAVSLQPAPYVIKAELSGFGTATREMVITIGASATLDLKLGVATLEESITVTAQTPIIEVAKAAPSSTIRCQPVSPS